jgi:hypothetical protein
MTAIEFTILFLVVIVVSVLALLYLERRRQRRSERPLDPPPPNSLEEWRTRAKQSQERSVNRRER